MGLFSHFIKLGLVAISVVSALAAQAEPLEPGRGDRPAGLLLAGRSEVLAQHGIAATSHPLASQIALDILKKGGTAVDAAIAANAALGLMEPTGSGIGGDLFAIVWDPGTARLHGLNASGRSPRGLTYEMMKQALHGRKLIPVYGNLPVTVPGAVDGWFELHRKFGRLPMTEILAPAIAYARNGFPVTQIIGHDLGKNAERFEREAASIGEVDNFRKVWLAAGHMPREGEIFRNPALAHTYELIAKGGRDAFYQGEISDVIDAYMKKIGGHLRKEDFAAHHSEWVDPVSVNYRGYDVFELPPNGQGIAALQMLNILEGFDLKAMGHNSADYLHVQTEAKKLAFADRARFYADPAFYDAPVKNLVSKAYATARRKLINMDHAALKADHGDPRLQGGDTIYLTVADHNGMMVSLIQSNYTGMGSGLMPDGLGFMLQDRGALFTMEKGHPNQYAPGKRPFHTIIPAFVMKEGKPWMSFGVMGGQMQPQGHVQILCNIIDFGMNLQEAGDAARYNHLGSSEPTGTVMIDGGTLTVESGVTPDVVQALRARGHKVIYDKGGFGGYEAIRWDSENQVYRGATEMRKDGMVVGY